jgi:hypothetical protein
MSTTWAQFLLEIREELGDTSATPRYSDKLLYYYLKDGIRDYSQYFPLDIVEATIEHTDESVRAFALPSTLLDIHDVQCPLDTHLQKRFERPGLMTVVKNKLLFYWIDGQEFILNCDPEDGDTLLLSYFAVHTIPPESVLDPVLVPDPEAEPPVEAPEEEEPYLFSVPDGDMELIKNYVIGKIQVKTRTAQSRLDRFKVTSGARDDNPMIIEAVDYMDRYNNAIATRIRGGTIQLFRPKRRVRVFPYGGRN